MAWHWEELTSPDFGRAVQEVNGVCVVPIGVQERHGEHLPVGVDMYSAREVVERAVAIEPAIIFPYYYFGQVHETKNYPGAIAIRRQLLFDLLENICEEIARNGMRKIVFVNTHGGNEYILPYFAMSMLERPRDFTVYVMRISDYKHILMKEPEWQAMKESEFDYHAGETETSVLLALRPELVHMDRLTGPGLPQKRLSHLPPMVTGTWWYADFPEQYAGDATVATAEKGEFILNGCAQKVAAAIKAIKADTVTPELEKEYFASIQHTPTEMQSKEL